MEINICEMFTPKQFPNNNIYAIITLDSVYEETEVILG